MTLNILKTSGLYILNKRSMWLTFLSRAGEGEREEDRKESGPQREKDKQGKGGKREGRKGGENKLTEICCFVDFCLIAQYENPGVVQRCGWNSSSFLWRLWNVTVTQEPHFRRTAKSWGQQASRSPTQSSLQGPGENHVLLGTPTQW